MLTVSLGECVNPCTVPDVDNTSGIANMSQSSGSVVQFEESFTVTCKRGFVTQTIKKEDKFTCQYAMGSAKLCDEAYNCDNIECQKGLFL